MSVDVYPLSFFLEQLARTGIPVGARDYRRINRALSSQGDWTLNRLERVLESLLVNDRDTRVVFRQAFRSHFRHEGLDADAVVDVAQWRQAIQYLLDNPHAPLSSSPVGASPAGDSSIFPTDSKARESLAGLAPTGDVPAPKWGFRRRLGWVFGVALLGALAFGLWQYFKPEPPTPTPIMPAVVDVKPDTKPQPQGKLFDTIKVTTHKPQADERILPDLWQPAAWLYGLLAALLGGVWWWRAHVPRVKRLPANPDLPAQYFDDALVGGALPPWLAEADNDHFADQLHYIVTDQFTREVDVPASVEASAQSGSVPRVRFERQRELQQILILVEQGLVQQRWHGLAEEFAHALQVRGVNLTLGRFNSSPARFVDQHGHHHYLEDWDTHQPHLLLLVFADTHKAIGLQRFGWADWSMAQLLTVQERRDWDHREQGLLEQGVTLWQADAAGLAAALDEKTVRRSLSEVKGNAGEHWREREGEACGDYLARVLGAALPWAQALALYPGAWSLAAAEVLRQTHFPEVPRLAVQRLLNVPGTWVAGGKAAFAPKVLVALRGGWGDGVAVIGTWTALLDAVEPDKASLAWAVWQWKRIRLRWWLDPDRGAKALDQLVQSFPALRQTVGDELVAIPLPTTRSGQKHLVAVSDRLGLQRADAYLPVRWQRAGSLAATVLAAVFVGVGYHNTTVPDGTATGEVKDVSVPHLVEIRGGKFTMGCVDSRDNVEGGCFDNEKPPHEVTVPDFAIGATEVTVAQYRTFVEATGREWKQPDFKQTDEHPAVNVSWDDAKAYLQWLSEQTQQEWRLPTEAEWEYAARAGADTAYPWGNAIGNNKANCYGDSCGDVFEDTASVANFAPYGGVYDMQGNVYEWAEDCWVGDYKTAPTDGSARQGSDTCVSRVVRGGSWDDIPRYLRASSRFLHTPHYRSNDIGFRVARTN